MSKQPGSPQKHDPARTLLERVQALQRPCDLDLLVFIARHSRALMSGEELAQLLGYTAPEIARSLDALIAAGFVLRTQNPARLTRMYLLTTGGADGRALLAVVEYASTRGGRLALRRALTASDVGGTGVQSMAMQAGH